MPEHDSSEFGQKQDPWINPLDMDLSQDKDLVMEQILDNIHNTPLGQVLKRIAALPEVRQQKVLQLRRQITEGRYELTERLEVALDKVLEDLIA
jgi:anti-sigma28 factor (negative regulator of flagellin synthesis)